jgi:hypothetical protein
MPRRYPCLNSKKAALSAYESSSPCLSPWLLWSSAVQQDLLDMIPATLWGQTPIPRPPSLSDRLESLSTVFEKVPSGGGQIALGDSLPGTGSVRGPAGGRITVSDRGLPRAGNVDPVAFGPPRDGV